MPATPLRLGPFVGGLNTGSDPTAIADAELVECTNLELDIDGSLVSRPPIQELDGHRSWTQRINLLCEATFAGSTYLIGSNSSGTYYYLDGNWSFIQGNEAAAAVQYAGAVYFIAPPNSGLDGGKWTPGGSYTPIAALPRGRCAVIHKERLFVGRGIDATTNESRIQFSDVGNFESWPASNFIDVGQGDGTKLIDLCVYQDNLLIFKSQSTYVLAYDIRPTDAVVKKISATIGVDGQHCVCSYENQVYIMHNARVYELINYDFNQLNVKVPFVRDQTSPSAFSQTEQVFVTLLNDRLVCRYYARVYVFNLLTKTWCEWESAREKLNYFGPIVTLHPPTGNEYYAGSCITAFTTFMRLRDESTATDKEQTIIPPVTIRDSFTRSVSNGWGAMDTGETYTTVGGAASDYSVNGSQGQMSLGSVNVERLAAISTPKVNFDCKVTVSTDKVATGSSISADIQARRIDGSNYYSARLQFLAGGGAQIEVFKVVAGTAIPLGGVSALGAYSANQLWNIRFQINGSTIKVKAWKASDPEPGGWNTKVNDTQFTTAGSFLFRGLLFAGNTNTLPVLLKWDDVEIGDMADAPVDIACKATTKNFDMAVPNQYKRLWWWGADVATARNIVGVATPIVVAFSATWADLSSRAWASLNTWAQPLITPSSVTTIVMTGTGTARRFAKFLKGLRYRQINFSVELVTDGTTGDGPAKLFTMVVNTESKQVVSKALT